MTDDEIKQQIDERIAAQLEAEHIAAIFANASEADREKIANALSRFMYDRQQALRKPENTYTPQWTNDGRDINYVSGTQFFKENVAGHAGPTLPRRVNILGTANVETWLTQTDPSELNIRIRGAGGADCMFNHLVSTCWATEVAAGRGIEGQTLYSVSGCPYRVWSTVQAAIDAADAAAADQIIYICPGDYTTEQLTLNALANANINIFIVGAGKHAVRIGTNSNPGIRIPAAVVGSYHISEVSVAGNIYALRSTASGASIVNLRNVIFEGRVAVDWSNSWVERCEFQDGLWTDSNATPANTSFSNCEFEGSAATWSGNTTSLKFQNSRWDSGNTSISITAGTHEYVSFIGGSTNGSGNEGNWLHFNGTASYEGWLVKGMQQRGSSIDPVIYFQALANSMGFTITANVFNTATGNVAYIQSDDADTKGCIVIGNAFTHNASGNYIEDTGGSSVSGTFTDGIFADNSPASDIRYNISGTGNRLDAITQGTGTPSHNANEGTLYFDRTANTMYMNTSSVWGTTWAILGVSGGGAAAPAHEHLFIAVVDATTASTSVPYHTIGPVPSAGTITLVQAVAGEDKTNGATSAIFDVHKILAANVNTDGTGTTIFTTAGNRPTISNGNRKSTTTAPDVTAVAAGDYLAVYTDQVGTSLTTATVSVQVRFT